MKHTIKIKLVFLICWIVCFQCLSAQPTEKRYHVQGKIIDARTKKGIKKIPFTVLPFKRIINANGEGAFLFNMPKGNYSFVVDYYPFVKQEVKLNLQSDTTLVIELHTEPGQLYLGEVEVISSKPATENPSSMERVDSHTLNSLPALIGERDIIKAFALTSGVTSSSEGAADMQVRGGVHGQNLYLLDEIPMFSTEHFFGLVSVYNPTIIKSAKLYKSDFPAEFGGKISSVVDVLTEDADLKKFKGEAEISVLTSKLGYNIPLIKDKLALTIAGRISNYSLANLVSPLLPEDSGARFSLHFGDINANLLWKLSEKDKLKLTFFSNTDGIDATSLDVDILTRAWMKNRQQNLGLNWYRTFSDKAENHLMAYTDVYGFDFGISTNYQKSNQKYVYQLLTGINSSGLVDKFTYTFSDKLNVKTGVSIKLFGFSPFQFYQNDTSINTVKADVAIQQTEIVAFAQAGYQLAKKQNLTAGLRLSTIGNADKMYTNLEPRIGYHGIFARDYSVSASIGRMTQPIHRAANPGLGMPFEIFLPSSSTIQPESSWNFSIGGAKDFAWNTHKFSIKADAWYKTLENVIDFKEGYDVLYSIGYSAQTPGITPGTFVTQGNGKAYGIDFSANYNIKDFSFSVDYTWMHATYQFDKLNNGLSFAAPTDIPHSLSLTSELKISESWTLVANWQYRSGRPITIPTYIFVNPSAPPHIPGFEYYYSESDYQFVETERNNFRTKAFQKLDISFNHKYKTRKKHNDAFFSMGLYNVYNQSNPYFYFIQVVQNKNGIYTPVLKSMSVFPVIPSFCWSLKF